MCFQSEVDFWSKCKMTKKQNTFDAKNGITYECSTADCGRQVVSKWSPSSLQVVTKWLPSSPQVVPK